MTSGYDMFIDDYYDETFNETSVMAAVPRAREESEPVNPFTEDSVDINDFMSLFRAKREPGAAIRMTPPPPYDAFLRETLERAIALSGQRRKAILTPAAEAVSGYIDVARTSKDDGIDLIMSRFREYRESAQFSAISELLGELQKRSADLDLVVLLSGLTETAMIKDRVPNRQAYKQWLYEKIHQTEGEERARKLTRYL